MRYELQQNIRDYIVSIEEKREEKKEEKEERRLDYLVS